MITLSIDNSTCVIGDLSRAQLGSLRVLLSYREETYTPGGYKIRLKPLITSRGEFPTGLLYLVDGWLQAHTVRHTRNDRRRRPKARHKLFTLGKHPTPYQDQNAAVEAAMSANRGIISMCTGFGKSLTMALLINAMQLKTLIVVPNLTLKKQLTESMLGWFGSLNNITIENIDSAKLEKCNDYDMLIIDEAHHVAASTYRKLNKKVWNKVFHRYFFTATPFRSREAENILMESVSGGLIYSVPYAQAVKVNSIVPVEAYYIDLPKTPTAAYSWAQVYSELVIHNKKRNEIISDLLLNLHRSNLSSLCLVKEIKHGETLTNSDAFLFASGQDSESQAKIDRFNEGRLKILIGTIGILGEGVDTRPCEFVIIAGLGKSKTQFMQSVGRAVRRYPGKESAKVILIRDPSHKFTLRHFKEQCKILKEEYGVIPVKLGES